MRLNRKEHIQPRALAKSKNAVGHFVHRVFLHFLAALQAIGAADAGEEQAQVIVDFGCRGDGRARIARRILLLDGDRGRDAVNHVGVGLLDALQKLPRVRGKRLDIAPLAFGINRIEGERRLARAGDSGDDGQAVMRDLKIDVLEVMNPGPANNNALCGHLPLALQTAQNSLPNLSIINRRQG